MKKTFLLLLQIWHWAYAVINCAGESLYPKVLCMEKSVNFPDETSGHNIYNAIAGDDDAIYLGGMVR